MGINLLYVIDTADLCYSSKRLATVTVSSLWLGLGLPKQSVGLVLETLKRWSVVNARNHDACRLARLRE